MYAAPIGNNNKGERAIFVFPREALLRDSLVARRADIQLNRAVLLGGLGGLLKGFLKRGSYPFLKRPFFKENISYRSDFKLVLVVV